MVAVFVTAPEVQMQAALEEMNSVASLVGEAPVKSIPLARDSFQQNIDTMDVNVNGVLVDFVDDSQFPEQQVLTLREKTSSPEAMLSISNGEAGTALGVTRKRDFSGDKVRNSPELKANPNDGILSSKSKPQQKMKEITELAAKPVPPASQVALSFPREQLSRLLTNRENVARYSYSDLDERNSGTEQNDGVSESLGEADKKTQNFQLAKPTLKQQVSKPTDKLAGRKRQRGRRMAKVKQERSFGAQRKKTQATRVAQYLFIFELSSSKRSPAPAERPAKEDSSNIWLPAKIRKT